MDADFQHPQGEDGKLQHLQGKDAYRHNAESAREVTKAVRTTLGPLGMDKMLVDKNGFVVVTNRAVTVLQEMAIEHPIGKMLLKTAEAQVRRAGDGTTTTLILVGELLEHAEDFLDQGIHPTSIVRGYRLAHRLAELELEKLAYDVEPGDEETYRRVARTSLNGRAAGPVDVDRAVELAVEATDRVTVDGVIDLDEIKYKRKYGRSSAESKLVPGRVLEAGPEHPQMPTSFDDASILILSGELAPPEVNESKATYDHAMGETSQKYHLRLDSAEQLQRFRDAEEDQLKRWADRIVELGADVVFCRRRLDERVADRLARAGVLGVVVGALDMKFLRTTTGSKVYSTVDDAEADGLGHARIYRDRRNELFFVERDDSPLVTVLLQGTSEQQVDEFMRSLKDATEAIGRVADDPRVVAGGGAIETELARRLRIHADSVSGREQLAIGAVAESLEAIPKTLAKTAGFDSTDALLGLRNSHTNGNLDAGVDIDTGEPADMYDAGVIEPLLVKQLALGAAIDATTQILRVDDIRPINAPFTYVEEDENAVDKDEEEEDRA